MSWIDTPEALRAVVDRATAAGIAAIDTEFVYRNTYFPQLGLIQIGLSEHDVVLVDPLAVGDLSPLGALLRAETVIKVLHSPDQDLALLQSVTRSRPRNIFDTQCAAGFVGLGHSLSLADLLADLFDMTIAKSETRTDWLQRPLTSRQRRYAADDVRYLCTAARELRRRMQSLQREAWFAEDMQGYNAVAGYAPPDPREAYLKFQGATRLTGIQRAALQALAAWREETARKLNTPRQWIMPDRGVMALARKMPKTVRHVRQLPKIKGRGAKHSAADLLRILRNVRAQPKSSHPPRPATLPEGEKFKAQAHFAVAFVWGMCMSAGVAPELAATRKAIHAHVAGHDSPLRRGWRHAFVGRTLDELLSGRHGLAIDPATRLPTLMDSGAATDRHSAHPSRT